MPEREQVQWSLRRIPLGRPPPYRLIELLSNQGTIMKTSLLITAAAILSLSAGTSFAQSLNSPAGSSLNSGIAAAPRAGQAVFTPRGPAFTTGSVGRMQTTTLPGGAGQGLLSNNGNGTSTLTGPGGIVTTIPTPR